MFKKIEKCTVRIPSCRIGNEIFNSLRDLLKELKLKCVLKSETTDIETDDVNLLIGSGLPANISLIRIKTLDSDRNIDIILNFRNNGKLESKVMVSGGDSIWVKGMAEELQNLFKKYQLWYSPITRYWQARLFMSIAIISFTIWQINHYLWKAVTPAITGITELQLFATLFLFSILFLYPFNRAILWLFPRFELPDSLQKKVRRIFWFLLVLLISWGITEFFFPHLLSE